MRFVWLLAALPLMAAEAGLDVPPYLPGTRSFELTQNWREEQRSQMLGYLDRRMEAARTARVARWQGALGSPESFQKLAAGERAVLRGMLGIGSHAGAVAKLEDGRVTITAGDGFAARALVVMPEGKAKGITIAIPRQDQTAEEFAEGSRAKMLTGRGELVLVAVTTPRTPGPQIADVVKRLRDNDRRRFLHRLAFVVGKTLTGMEVEQVMALRDAARERHPGMAVKLYGEEQGAVTALLAAAVDTGFAGAEVDGGFSSSADVAEQPVDRMLYGQLLHFSGAEFAGLVAPRPLAVVSNNADEFARAESYYKAAGKPGALRRMEAETESAPSTKGSAFADENFDALHRYLRRLIEASEAKRYERWGLLKTGTPAAKAAELRRELARWMGVPTEAAAAMAPRTHLLKVTASYAAYEVKLGVLEGVEVYGHLLVPRKREKLLPAIVCQHGLDGQPKDITGLGPKPNVVYHQYGARLAEQGYVVFAPYLTVPAPQRELINPIVRKAAAVGMMRTAIEVRKLRRVVDFLETLPYVDKAHIGYYGLSYGGYSTIWMGPLDTRLKAVIISGHFNDWRPKIVDESNPASYFQHPDEDFFNWDVLHRFTHPELIAAMYPRAVMVEFADQDTTTNAAWHARAWKQVEEISAAWKTEDRVERDAFLGVHEIGGMRTFDFAARFLKPGVASERAYTYTVWPSLRDLPGIGDSDDDSLPYVSTRLESLSGYFTVGSGVFEGLEFRLSRWDDPSALTVRYGTKPGAADIGTVKIEAGTVHPLFDLWYAARIPAVKLTPGRRYWVTLGESAADGAKGHYVVYGRKPLGGKAAAGNFYFAYRPVGAKLRGQEETFDFVRTYLEAPAAPSSGRAGVMAGGAWKIDDRVKDAEGVTATAAAGFEKFAAGCCGVRMSAGASRRIVLETRAQVEGVTTAEGFSVTVGAQEIHVTGTTARGVMRGLYWMEDELRSSGLKAGTTVRNARFPVRMTTSLYIGGLRYTESSRPFLYTPGLFERISRDGFNGVWIWMNVEEAAGDLSVFPELTEPDAAARLRRVEEVARLGKKYGVDVWVYLATNYNHPVPESFYAKYPETRGIGYNNAMCTSDERVRRYQADVVRNIVRRAPAIAGLVVIYDSEGFYYCGNHEASRKKCPRCSKRTCVDLSLQVLTNINTAMHEAGGAAKRLIAFSYSRGEDWLPALFAKLPKDITLQVDFSKGGIVERDGIRHQTGDYNLTLLGPPAEFVEHHALAEKYGLKFITKTEHAVSQEFIFVPYIPAMQQWLARIGKIREYPADGWFGNWCHYGYLASLPAQLFTRMSFDPVPEGDQVLRELARNNYGEAAVPAVLAAWQHFSEGIRQFPYSDNVSRIPGPLQKGPSNPFYLDASIPSSGRWRAWQNDLKWTAPWGPQVAAKYLKLVREEFHRGIAELARAEAGAVTAEHRAAIRGEWRIARTIESSLDSILNEIDWIEARDAQAGVERMRAILLRERENVLGVLPLLEEDSRLGYASEGGGVIRGGLFTPALVRWKLGELDDALIRGLVASNEKR